MEICQVKQGMLVECAQGIGKVLVVDRATNSVLIEEQSSQRQLAVEVSQLIDSARCHSS